MTRKAHEKKTHDNLNDDTYGKGKFCRRKGMAIELALFVMLVVFAGSALTVTSVLADHKALIAREQQTVHRSVVDELAERLLADPNSDPTTLDDRFDGYHYRWDPDTPPQQESRDGTAQYFASLVICKDMDDVLTVRVQIDVAERTVSSKPSEETEAPAQTAADAVVVEMKILEWIYH